MANFNTNQTRHFYVAKAIDSSVDTNGDIAVKSLADGKFYFAYKNADGLLVRSDLIDPKCVTSVKKTAADDMNIPLMAHTVAINSSVVDITSSSMTGKTLSLIVTIHQAISYDESDTISFVAPVYVSSSINTAALFHKALAKAVVEHMPKGFLKVFTYGGTEVTKANADSTSGHANGIILVPCAQKWVRGKMANEPVTLSVAFSYKNSNYEDIQWGTDVVAKSSVSGNTSIPSAYALADLEYFAYGERGDFNRGNWYHEEPTYIIDPTDGTKKYNVLSIEFYYAGGAEDVQKSPRLIQVAAEAKVSDDVITSLYEQVNALIAPAASGSGAGA